MTTLAPRMGLDRETTGTPAAAPMAAPGRWVNGDFGDRDHPIEHVKYAIGNTPVRTYPFEHQYVSNVFPTDYYREILNHLPDPRHYKALIPDYPKRGTIVLSDKAAVAELDAPVRPFWEWFARFFGSRQFMSFALERYAPSLAGRFRSQVNASIYLFRDAGGYGIGPHTDTFKKVVTMLFYLPSDDSQRDFGTSVVVPKPECTRTNHAGHNTWDDYRSMFTAPFAPNSMFSFAVTDKSLHAVRATPPGTVRNSIQYFLTLPD